MLNEMEQRNAQLQPFIANRTEDTQTINSRRKERQKWRTTLYWFVFGACAVLFINIGFLAWAVRGRGITGARGVQVGVISERSCDSIKKANIGIHLVINVLSSALLGASNYCMQCLSAPTRSEVDKAHRAKTWLDIGVPSLHNVASSHLSSRKKICWWVLALSSLPLHLCYNSVVFASLTPSQYHVFEFGPEAKAAIEHGSYNGSRILAFSGAGYYSDAFKAGNLQNLSLVQCINAYSIDFQSTSGNVFLVVDEGVMDAVDIFTMTPDMGIVLSRCAVSTGTDWVSGQFRTKASKCFAQEASQFIPRLRANSSMWTPFNGHPVKQCLSQPVELKCKLRFSVHLALVVIVFNAIKALTVVAAIFELRKDPILTIGDAAASFLEEPDSFSKYMCLVSQRDIQGTIVRHIQLQKPRAYKNQRSTWASSVKMGKLSMVWLSMFAAFGVLLSLFAWGYSAIQGEKDIGSVLRIGLQSADPRTIIKGESISEQGISGVIQNTFTANSSQVIISFVYFSYNATITSMLLAHEWSGFFTRSKSLRVSSNPRGLQRSTYFLQLPYRYAIPLIGFSALLHWLASQSLSVVSVEFGPESYVESHSTNYEPSIPDFITMSYSPLGILLSLIVVVVMSMALFFLGRKQLNPMPVVGSCSVAIAASCQAKFLEPLACEKPLKWGVFALEGDQRVSSVGRCGLSSHDVNKPVEDTLYQ